MSLALRTLLYDWRRFLPAVVAVAFSGLLVLMQAAIILGIFSLSSLYVTRSQADLWIGSPGVQSVDLGRPLAPRAELFTWMNPHVRRVEPFLWGSGEWRTRDRGMVNVYIVGVDVRPDAMALADALPPDLRAAIAPPGSVLVDQADLHKLQVRVGDLAEINGHRVRVAGVTHGLRGLGGVNAIASLQTTRALDPAAGADGRAAYLLVQLDAPSNARGVAASLNAGAGRRSMAAQTAEGFARRTTAYWLVESGAGVGFVLGSLVALLVAVIITSQTLAAAVAGSLKEYAALRALGFPMSTLRRIVLAQSGWVGAAGLAAAAALGLLLVLAARAGSAPVVVSAPMMAAAGALVMATALASGLFALRRVGEADPSVLLL
jgi:putative ABC transport system permease protein